MCGRYYIDDETMKEIEKLVRSLDKKLFVYGKGRDIYPSQEAAVLFEYQQNVSADFMKWGFPGYGKGQLLINSRAESALEKKNFRENILNRRCVIPAKGFYEWNVRKEKSAFFRDDGMPLFMAGCYGVFDGQRRFSILTTAANVSVSPVHARMPLILDRDEVSDWILEGRSTRDLLHKIPAPLKRAQDYEQMSLF